MVYDNQDEYDEAEWDDELEVSCLCPTCYGEGVLDDLDEEIECYRCHGSGVIGDYD
jgi:DnaJ-class molecular chaperone